MVLLISYDLNGHERPDAYQRVKAAIEQYATAELRILYSQWLVETNYSPVAWWNMLEALIDSNDRVFIVQVPNRASYGYLDPGTWEWLERRGIYPTTS